MTGAALTPTGVLVGATNGNARVSIDASRATDALALPTGNTGQRPTGILGEIRFNTTLNDWEGFITSWVPVGGSGIQIQNNNAVVNTTAILNFVNSASVLVIANDDFTHSRVNLEFIAVGGATVNVGANATYDIQVANINFNNTSTVNVNVQAVTGNTANVAFQANVAAITALTEANVTLAYNQANAAYTQANTALTQGTPGGANLDIQYNLNGAFSGDSNLIWNVANTTLVMTGKQIITGSSTLNGNVFIGMFEGSNSVLILEGINGTQLVLQSQGADFGVIANPVSQVWVLGASGSSGNAQPSINVLSWTATGNVGIGTINPKSNLDVIGNVNVSTNMTVNGVSFIPKWTNATMSSGYLGTLGGGWSNVGFWVDPFGMCHVRGLVETSGNLSITAATGANIANGFPSPNTGNSLGQVAWSPPAANNTSLPSGNTLGLARVQIYSNGAFQLIQTTMTGNLGFIILDGFNYSTLS